MHKKLLIFLFAIFLTSSVVSASEIDIAYVLKDNSQPSQKILDVINANGMNYEIVRNSQIPMTNFSRYNVSI